MLLEISGEITRKNEEMEPKQKQYQKKNKTNKQKKPVVNVTGDGNKV